MVCVTVRGRKFSGLSLTGQHRKSIYFGIIYLGWKYHGQIFLPCTCSHVASTNAPTERLLLNEFASLEPPDRCWLFCLFSVLLCPDPHIWRQQEWSNFPGACNDFHSSYLRSSKKKPEDDSVSFVLHLLASHYLYYYDCGLYFVFYCDFLCGFGSSNITMLGDFSAFNAFTLHQPPTTRRFLPQILRCSAEKVSFSADI